MTTIEGHEAGRDAAAPVARGSVPDPGAAGRAAIEARRARAAVKRALAAGQRGPRDVAERAWQEPASTEGRLRVSEYLGSLRGMGPRRVESLMAGLGIAQLPDYMVKDDIARGRLVELLPRHRPPTMPIHAVIRSCQISAG